MARKKVSIILGSLGMAAMIISMAAVYVYPNGLVIFFMLFVLGALLFSTTAQELLRG